MLRSLVGSEMCIRDRKQTKTKMLKHHLFFNVFWCLTGSRIDRKSSTTVYIDDVPLEGPKTKMVKKWSGNGFGPCQMTCPKSCRKVPKKWSKNGPSQIWVQKTAQKVVKNVIKKLSKSCFLENRAPKRGAAAEVRRAPFWVAAEGRHLDFPKNNFLSIF